MNHRINHQIRLPNLRVVDQEGRALGVFTNQEAQIMAREAGLDLVEINPSQRPPICKIMDYGKFKYDSGKREKELRKKNKGQTLKEVQFSPTVDTNDIAVKVRKIREFIGDGNKVKVTMRFRGRQLAHVDLGRRTFMDIIDGLKDVAAVERRTEFSGNTLISVIAPAKSGGRQ